MFQQIYEILVSVKKSEHIPDLPTRRNFPHTPLLPLFRLFPSNNDFYSWGQEGVMLLCDERIEGNPESCLC